MKVRHLGPKEPGGQAHVTTQLITCDECSKQAQKRAQSRDRPDNYLFLDPGTSAVLQKMNGVRPQEYSLRP